MALQALKTLSQQERIKHMFNETNDQLIKIFLRSGERAANAQTPFDEKLAEAAETAAFNELIARGVQLIDHETLNYTDIVKQIL